MTDDQRRLKEKLEAIAKRTTETIEEVNNGLATVSDLQLVTLEGLADTNEQQADGSLTTLGGLADMFDLLLVISDRLDDIDTKLGS